jgi:hypothetical protein
MLDEVLIANELVDDAKKRGKVTILFKVDFKERIRFCKLELP